MRGSIKQRAKGSWSIIVYLGKDTITNKKMYKWFTFRGTKKQAEVYLAEKLNEINNGTFTNDKDMLLEDYLNYWYKETCVNKLSPTTYESYRNNLDIHIIPILGHIKLKDLQPLYLQNFYSDRLDKGLSKTTVLYLHRILHCALGQATKWQLISRNIADNVEPPKKDNYEAKVLSPKDLKNLLNALNKNDFIYIPVMIALSTGMRRGEVAGLKWNNVDLDNGYINVVQTLYTTKTGLKFSTPKTKKSIRKITIPPTLVTILQEHKKNQTSLKDILDNNYIDNNLVCCLDNGEPINPDMITWKFRNFLKRNNLPKIRFHDLRHSHASLLLMQGVQAKMISERLGHSNISITMDLYTHIYEESNKELANQFEKFLS